jgi:galactokinase
MSHTPPQTLTAALSERLTEGFASAYRTNPSLIARAPGRVNLIGEHTDYNDGFVLPCAIDFSTQVAARQRDGRMLRIRALDQGGQADEFSLEVPVEPSARGGWTNHVRGMVAQLQNLGVDIPGADIAIAGDVPRGAGLSSSASLALAIGSALLAIAKHHDIGGTALALAAQKSEHEFVGCHCGIMDQLASAHGAAQHALLIDCRSLAAEAVAMPADAAIMIVHSGVSRGLVDSAYNERRAQCEAAATYFDARALRDVSESDVAQAQGLDALTLRRARHVVSENARTIRAAQALAESDWPSLSKLMSESHASLRDDFEVSVAPVDALVSVLQAALGNEGGARMTGGGFGGCVVALMPNALKAEAARAVARGYLTPSGEAATVYWCRASAGVEVVHG